MTKQYNSEEIARAEGSILTYLKMLEVEKLNTIQADEIAKYLGYTPALVLEVLNTLEKQGKLFIKYTLSISLNKSKRNLKKAKTNNDSVSKNGSSDLSLFLKSNYQVMKGDSISKLVEAVIADGEQWNAFELAGELYDLTLAQDNGLEPEAFTKPINTTLSSGVKSGKWIRVKTGVYQLNNSNEVN